MSIGTWEQMSEIMVPAGFDMIFAFQDKCSFTGCSRSRPERTAGCYGRLLPALPAMFNLG